MARPGPDPDYILVGCSSPVTSLLYIHKSESKGTGDEIELISGLENGTVLCWDLQLRRVYNSLEAHIKSVLSLHRVDKFEGINSEGIQILTQGREGFIYMWQVSGNQWTKLKSFQCASLGFCPIAVLMSGTKRVAAVVASGQAEIQILDIDNGNVLNSLVPASSRKCGMCTCIKFANINTPESPDVVAGYEDGGVILWNTVKNKERCHIQAHSDAIVNLDFNRNLSKLVTVSVDENVHVWSVEGNNITEKTKITITNPGFNCVLFRPDNKLFITGGWDNKVRVFHSKRDRQLAVLSFHKDSIQSIAYDVDNTLAVGSKDETISVWSVYKS